MTEKYRLQQLSDEIQTNMKVKNINVLQYNAEHRVSKSLYIPEKKEKKLKTMKP